MTRREFGTSVAAGVGALGVTLDGRQSASGEASIRPYIAIAPPPTPQTTNTPTATSATSLTTASAAMAPTTPGWRSLA